MAIREYGPRHLPRFVYCYDMMENKNVAWGIVVVALLVGFFGGWYYGKVAGVKESDHTVSNLKQSLDMFVPPLPDVVNVLGGKITAINGDSFAIEIPSLTDRYPKPGVPMVTETKTIRVTSETVLTDTNFDPKTFKNGLPQTKTISASDLKTGDTISVTISENARTEQNLTAVSINRSSGI